jgi:hypothetical protein
MEIVQSPSFVKLFVAVLYKDVQWLNHARDQFITLWGTIDYEGMDHVFDVTDYYESEMGTLLLRRLVSFEKLVDPMIIVDMKIACNAIENRLAENGKRRINCDAGYLDHNKVLLASAKEAGQKVYLGKGIYADLAGRYKAGKYQPFEWSFPDFKDGRYEKELLEIRAKYLTQVRKNK